MGYHPTNLIKIERDLNHNCILVHTYDSVLKKWVNAIFTLEEETKAIEFALSKFKEICM